MPPPCQMPEKSGLPSAVRFIAAGAWANKTLEAKIVRITAFINLDICAPGSVFDLLHRAPPLLRHAIGEGDLPREQYRRTIPRDASFEGNHITLLELLLRPSGPKQRVWREAFQGIIHDFARRILDVHIDKGVWIGPLDLGDLALHRHALGGIKLRRIRMMRH